MRLADALPRDPSVLRLFATYGAQAIQRFELVHQLPLTLGLVLDTSGSMRESLIEAKAAATAFLAGVMTPRDRCFAVGFAERPGLLMPLTSDAHALETAFRDLPALGNTSLHDALVYSLYQYRGVRGRKAMVVLSDGDDTSSLVPWEDALAFAERSGVAIYTVGLDVGAGSPTCARFNLLGHRRLKETAIYLHLSRRHLHAAINPLDQISLGDFSKQAQPPESAHP